MRQGRPNEVRNESANGTDGCPGPPDSASRKPLASPWRGALDRHRQPDGPGHGPERSSGTVTIPHRKPVFLAHGCVVEGRRGGRAGAQRDEAATRAGERGGPSGARNRTRCDRTRSTTRRENMTGRWLVDERPSQARRPASRCPL